jgi:N-methylhydantoinase B
VDLEVEGMIRSNSRAPDAAVGDIRSQVGCCRYGAELVEMLCAEYGFDTLVPAMAEILAATELQVRQALRGWPDGEHAAETFLDDDGVSQGERLPIKVRVHKSADTLTVDVSGSAGAVPGPINLRPQAVETAVALATVTMADPKIRINAGILRPIEIINPPGQITHAQWPSPVNSYFGNTLVIYSTLLKAMSEFNDRRAVGSVGLGQGAFAIGYHGGAGRERTVQYEVMGSSLGGTPQFDGTNVVQGMQHNTPNTPVEVLETEYPVRVVRHEWVIDSCGAGRFRGGPGYVKEYEVLAEALLTLRLGNSFENGGWGVRGGHAGRNARAVLVREQESRELRPLETVALRAGDRLQIHMAGGGGYGDPRQRGRQAVVDDVRNGYVSARVAVEVYGLDRDQLPSDGIAGATATARGTGR